MDFTKNLKNKNVLITGASRGIGKACAIAFSEVGCKIAIHYSKNKAAAMEVQQSINTKTHVIQADLSLEKDCNNLIRKTGEIFGRIDVLAINHGIWERGEIHQITANDVNRTIDLNLK